MDEILKVHVLSKEKGFVFIPLDDFIRIYDKRMNEMLDEKLEEEGLIKVSDLIKASNVPPAMKGEDGCS